MAELNRDQRFLPCLLDRLRDDDPKNTEESRNQRVISAQRYKEAVLRDLRWLFNASAHPRTVAGVARSLGAPIVAARPSLTEGSVVTIVVGWELSWYRFEVDLADEAAGPRITGQGTELAELDAADQVPNAAADDHG